jgi:hypothetical protein
LRRSSALGFAVFPAALFLLVFSSIAQAPPTAPPAQKHRITVKFNYNFAANHGCGSKNNGKLCVRQFNVYNLTDRGQRIRLFSFPAPSNARKFVQGVSATSPELAFSPGQHMIAVTAESNSGKESNAFVCFTMIYIRP